MLSFNKIIISIFFGCLILFSGLIAGSYDFNKFSSLAQQRYGNDALTLATNLNQLLLSLNNATETEKLVQINQFFNQHIDFGEDIFVWGTNDYWASPLETIGRAAGDCEDFTIAKYVFLKILGVPNEKLRLTYVKARLSQYGQNVTRAHMVLSYYASPQSDPLILDNLVPNITSASSRTDLTPIFTFNDKGLWVGNSNTRKGSASTHLSKWRDLLVRINEDGLE